MQIPRYSAWATAVVLYLSAGAAGAVAQPDVAAQLDAMATADQRIRSAPDTPEIRAEMLRVDARHEAALRDIITRHGWPDEHMVGKHGLHAVWLLMQHASPALLKLGLPHMVAAADRGELPWAVVALSVDRDLMYDGKPQRYGSQFRRSPDGRLEMYMVEDEAHLDERRAKVGLGPIAEYRAELEAM